MKKNIKIVLIFFIIFIIVFFVSLFIFFPISYKTKIDKYAKRYNLDSVMVASVINIESRFQKKSKSASGAIGLMQILPTTAMEIARKLNYDYSKLDLYDEDINIEFGCFYLSYLNSYFEGKTDNVLASYNWGLGNVKNWIKNGNVDSNSVIKNIPIKETKNYIKKYRICHFVYKYFYKL